MSEVNPEAKVPMKSSKFVLIGVAVVALSFSACSKQSAESETAKAAAPEIAVPAIEIRTSTAVERVIERDVETVGTLLAEDEVTVSSQVRGEVSEISVDVGSVVRAGQVVARISPEEYRLKLDQAEAALKQSLTRLGLSSADQACDVDQAAEVRQAKAALDDAQLKLDRAKRLVSTGDVSRERLDAMEINHRTMDARYQAARDNTLNLLAAVEQRKAEVKLARKNLDDSLIRSPIDGFVSVKHVSRGEYISEMGGNRSIVTVVKSNPIRVQASVSEIGISFVKPGLTVSFTVDAFPGRFFPGTVSRISPVVNSQSRLLSVEATAPNPDGALKPGMFAKVFVKASNRTAGIFVPSPAVSTNAGLNKVFVVEQGRVTEREVRIGFRDPEFTEIVSGVKNGETVAVSNLEKLSTGASVATK